MRTVSVIVPSVADTAVGTPAATAETVTVAVPVTLAPAASVAE